MHWKHRKLPFTAGPMDTASSRKESCWQVIRSGKVRMHIPPETRRHDPVDRVQFIVDHSFVSCLAQAARKNTKCLRATTQPCAHTPYIPMQPSEPDTSLLAILSQSVRNLLLLPNWKEYLLLTSDKVCASFPVTFQNSWVHFQQYLGTGYMTSSRSASKTQFLLPYIDPAFLDAYTRGTSCWTPMTSAGIMAPFRPSNKQGFPSWQNRERRQECFGKAAIESRPWLLTKEW